MDSDESRKFIKADTIEEAKTIISNLKDKNTKSEDRTTTINLSKDTKGPSTNVVPIGGGTNMYHYNESRALTNRERASLPTFPDDYLFVGNKESARKQFGMLFHLWEQK